MTSNTRVAILGAALALACVSQPAVAQKSKDTLRMPLVRQISVLDPFMETGAPGRFIADTIHDELICYNEQTHKLAPLLAKSFKQIDDKTLEFVLRDDVKWQDGEKFSADDVTYFLGWASGPQSKLRFKETWAWIDKVEKTGPNTIRITAKRPAPFYLMRMAFETWIYPKHIHSKLADPRLYGKAPVGTGPYKAVKVEKSGIDLAKNPYFKHGGDCKPPSNIGNVQIRLVADISSQIAGYIAGDWDLLSDVNQDQAKDLAKNPRFVAEINPVMGWIFATLDANNITGNSPFKDKRVRQAFFAAVDRKELARLYWGSDHLAFSTDNLCFKFMEGCDYADNQIKYDPEKAKKLLAEAGYPNGVDIELSSVINTIVGDLAKVMQAQVAKVGFRMKLDLRAFPNYLKQETEGHTMIRNSLHSPRIPDVVGMTNYFFEPTAPRNRYFIDTKSAELADASEKEMDPVKRRALIHQLADYNAEQALVLPVVSSAVVFTHTNEISVKPGGRLEIFGFYMSDLNWK